MSYQVLARKWRPREFSSLIGQQAVVTALTNALSEGRIAQAYLFSGIRGVGKTTAARIFATALNCEKGPERGPCNECATCREITAGADLDVLEIDAATYSKVEQVRELAESLKYGPTRDRYKVVVLDEVHRLSRQAFDALLKIVEEPPPRLVFIFATTEADAVPATILSRCQEFHFRRVGASEVAAHLAEICRAESIAASERALRLIARAGEGSVRDSVALLDQLATFGKGAIEEEEAARLVGGLDLALFGQLLGAILAGDSAKVAVLAREVETQGWDPRQVHAHFLGYCRDALHLALGADAGAVDLPEEEARVLGTLAREAGYENLLRLLHHLLGSEATVRRSDAALLALELAWLRAAELPKLVRIEELLGAETIGAAPKSSAPTRVLTAPSPPHAAPSLKSIPAPARPVAVPPLAPPTQAEPKTREPAPRSERATSEQPADDAAKVERFREELSARRPTMAARLAGATLDWKNGTLTIALAGDDPMAAAQLARNSNRELLDEATVAAFGAGSAWRLVESRAPAASPMTSAMSGATTRATTGAVQPDGDASAQRTASPAETRVENDPRVQAVLDIFGGGVASVARSDAGAGAGDAAPGASPGGGDDELPLAEQGSEPDTEAE